jgi:hypothetical protein
MSTCFHTVFAADTHLAVEQLLCEEPTANRGKSLKLKEGMRMHTVSSKEGQCLVHPL